MCAEARRKITFEQVENAGWDVRIQVFRANPVVDAYVVTSERFVVVVDTLINPAFAGKMLAFAQAELAEGRQLLVVNTHADWDHVWGNQVFAGPGITSPVPIIAQANSLSIFEAPEAQKYLFEMQAQSPGLFEAVTLTPPTIFFDERLRIAGGDLTLELFAAPGHTQDHLSIFIPEISTLLVGDAAEAPYPAARAAALFPRLRRTLEALAARQPAVALYCHAPGVTTAEVIHDNLAYFEALELCCRRALAEGRIPAELPEDADLAALTDCRFEDAIPPRRNTPDLHEYYRTTGHQEQLRFTLEMLRREISLGR